MTGFTPEDDEKIARLFIAALAGRDTAPDPDPEFRRVTIVPWNPLGLVPLPLPALAPNGERLAQKFDAAQARAPAGTPDGGQWVEQGGGASAGGAVPSATTLPRNAAARQLAAAIAAHPEQFGALLQRPSVEGLYGGPLSDEHYAYVLRTSEKYYENLIQKTGGIEVIGQRLDEYLKKGLGADQASAAWYETNQLIDTMFGRDADVFKKILAACSPSTSTPANVTFALSAYAQWKAAGERLPPGGFRGMGLDARVGNLERIARGEPMEGPKVNAFYAALNGDTNAVVIDIWMMRAVGLKGDSPNDAEYAILEGVIRARAATAGVKPAEFQAAVWAGKRGEVEAERRVTRNLEIAEYERARAGYLARGVPVPKSLKRPLVRGQEEAGSFGEILRKRVVAGTLIPQTSAGALAALRPIEMRLLQEFREKALQGLARKAATQGQTAAALGVLVYLRTDSEATWRDEMARLDVPGDYAATQVAARPFLRALLALPDAADATRKDEAFEGKHPRDDRGRFAESATDVGITSGRPDYRDPVKIQHDLRRWAHRLRALGVHVTAARLGDGGWVDKHGTVHVEPAWVLRYKGNGKALEALRTAARLFEQDAVLIRTTTRWADDAAQPHSVWRFDHDLSDREKAHVNALAQRAGLGGWTYDPGSKSLGATYVPDWDRHRVGPKGHREQSAALTASLRGAGFQVRERLRPQRVHAMTKENDYA